MSETEIELDHQDETPAESEQIQPTIQFRTRNTPAHYFDIIFMILGLLQTLSAIWVTIDIWNLTASANVSKILFVIAFCAQLFDRIYASTLFPRLWLPCIVFGPNALFLCLYDYDANKTKARQKIEVSILISNIVLIVCFLVVVINTNRDFDCRNTNDWNEICNSAHSVGVNLVVLGILTLLMIVKEIVPMVRACWVHSQLAQ